MLTWQHCKGAFLSYFKSYLNNKETDSLNSPLFGITWHLVSSHRNTLTQENTSAVVISPGWLWYLMSQGDQNTHKADTKEPWETISVWVWVSVCVSLCEVLLCDSLGGLKACPNGWAIWSSGDWLERKRLLFFLCWCPSVTYVIIQSRPWDPCTYTLLCGSFLMCTGH